MPLILYYAVGCQFAKDLKKLQLTAGSQTHGCREREFQQASIYTDIDITGNVMHNFGSSTNMTFRSSSKSSCGTNQGKERLPEVNSVFIAMLADVKRLQRYVRLLDGGYNKKKQLRARFGDSLAMVRYNFPKYQSTDIVPKNNLMNNLHNSTVKTLQPLLKSMSGTKAAMDIHLNVYTCEKNTGLNMWPKNPMWYWVPKMFLTQWFFAIALRSRLFVNTSEHAWRVHEG